MNTYRFQLNSCKVKQIRGAPKVGRSQLQVQCAITRTKKEQIVSTLRQGLRESCIVLGIDYKNLTVKDMTELRAKLPDESKLYVAKNSLMQKAIEFTEKEEGLRWDPVKKIDKEMNAWLFIKEQYLKDSIKAYRAYSQEQLEKVPKDKSGQLTSTQNGSMRGGAMAHQEIDPSMFDLIEKLPTRQELYRKLIYVLKQPATRLVRVLNQPATKLVRVLKQPSTKLVTVLKQISEKDEDKSKLVSDFIVKK